MRLWPSLGAVRGTSVAVKQEEETLEQELETSLESLEPAICAEALCVVLSSLVGFILGRATSFLTSKSHRHRKVPSWIMIIFGLLVVRTKYAEVGLVRALNKWHGDASIKPQTLLFQDFNTWPPSLAFTLSALEALDAPSDGVAIATASLAGTEVHHRFVESYRTGSLAFMVPVIDRLGIAGIMSINQVIASVAQVVAAMYDVQVATDLGGLGAMARRLPKQDGGPGWIASIGAVGARVLLETAPQMLWQTSLLMAQGIGFVDQPLLTISILLSFFAMTKKVFEMVRVGVAEIIEKEESGAPSEAWAIIAVMLAIQTAPLIMFLLYMSMRLYMMEVCPSHVWGLSTGCVSFQE
jgi:hypothetical protein